MKVFVEASSLARQNISGVGNVTLHIVKELDRLCGVEPDLTVTLLVPFGTKHMLEPHELQHVHVKQLTPPAKILNYLLTRTPLYIPVDMLVGRGVYIFPDYKNWNLMRSKSVTFIHDVAFRKLPNTVNQKNLRYLRANIPRWISRADKIVTISHASKAEIVNFYPETANKIDVVPLGVDKKFFYPRTAHEIRKTAKRYGLPENYFIAVGNIEPRKNISTLLAAYREYRDGYDSSCALVLVGADGWNNESILTEMRSMQQGGYEVFHLRSVPSRDLPALYSGAKANIHIALHEGFGLPPVEALACGTPVIVSNIPAMREVLKSSATYVQPTDILSLAQALMYHEKHLARPKHTVEYSWEATVQKLIAILTSARQKD